MSALGQKQTFASQEAMSALLPIADICGAQAHVRYVPIADMCPVSNEPVCVRRILPSAAVRPKDRPKIKNDTTEWNFALQRATANKAHVDNRTGLRTAVERDVDA